MMKSYPVKFVQETVQVWGLENDKMMQACVNNHYEEHVMQHLSRLWQGTEKQPRFPILIDIGAHVGMITMAWAQAYPVGVSYAFEPSEELFECLRANSDGKPIFPVNAAVGYGRETVAINHCARYTGVNFVSPERREDFVQSAVQCVSLDGWLANKNIQPHAIKIDTEGCEIPIIIGAMETIRKWKPHLLIEYNPIQLRANGHTEPRVLFELLRRLYQHIDQIGGNRIDSFADIPASAEMAQIELWCRG